MVSEEVRQKAASALHALEEGNCVRALAITDQVLAAGGDEASLRCLRANALLRMNRAREALEEAQVAVRLEPENATCHLAVGWAAWEAERWGVAQQALESAVRWSDRAAWALIEYARFMACCRGPRPAWKAARQAVEADPDSAVAWATLALAQYRMHRHQEAEQSISRALKIDPNDLLAQSVTMALLEAKGETSKAAAVAQLMRDVPEGKRLAESFDMRQRERAAVARLYERDESSVSGLLGEGRTSRRRRRAMRICLVLVPLLMAGSAAPAGPPIALLALLCFGVVSWRLWRYVE